MNAKAKRRLAVVLGIIAVVVVVLAAFGAGTSAKTTTVAQAAKGSAGSGKIQVTGTVVDNSYTIDGDVLTFSMYDPDDDQSVQLKVRYDKGVSATFGNGVQAICTGRMGSDGVLECSELVTKCPSKYESATDALSVARLVAYGSDVVDKPIKVTGNVQAGTLASAGNDVRLVIEDADGASSMPVAYDGALPDDVTDGTALVLTGSLDSAGTFQATDVALPNK